MTGITIDGSVVVVTGASSGIGRATALALAERGACVVAAARSGRDLDEVARECEARGRPALAIPTDVADREEVYALAEWSVEHFGHVDAWINAAAVMSYGEFWDVPTDAFHRVLETNLLGTIYGCQAALRHFRDRGSGVVVNVSSVYGRVTTPYVSPYVVSKYAVRGLTQTLRQETAKFPGIDVCGVYPQAVDTPIFRQAANYTNAEVTALPLTVSPDRVVRRLLRCLERPRPETIVGGFGHLLAVGRALAPWVYDRLAPYAMERLAFRSQSTPPSSGNLFEPQPRLNAIEGGWRAERRTARRVAGAAAAALAAVPVIAWSRRRRAT